MNKRKEEETAATYNIKEDPCSYKIYEWWRRRVCVCVEGCANIILLTTIQGVRRPI